ncbi:hypothetical protein [Luteimonas qiangzhengi]|uniref:hypothetical protein n=1 Tax=Luteimonas sp. MJ146 TaxID=3129240 RepID=UPI0031BAEC56
MRATFPDQLGRFRAHAQAGRPLPLDLAEWVEARLVSQVYADYQRARRDELLRRAGQIAGGSVANQVEAIEREAAALERCWHRYSCADPEPGTLRGAVHRARLVMAIPKRRRLFTILGAQVQSVE